MEDVKTVDPLDILKKPAKADGAKVDGAKATGKDDLCIANKSGGRLRDPYSGVNFPQGATVRVPEINGWIQSQIDAGLLEIGSVDNVGR